MNDITDRDGPREGATKCHACGDYPRTHQSITMETRIHPGVNPCTAYTWVICRNRPKCRAALTEAVAQALEDAR